MNFILNIGLDVAGHAALSAHVALQILAANDLLTGKHKVIQSDTEPTLVVEVTPLMGPTLALQAFKQTAIDLRQDCIAVYRPRTKGGALLGPKPWGKFNPAFFLMLDGKRLQQEVVCP